MWIFELLTTIWSRLFQINIGNLGFSFGTLLLGIFILSFLADTIYQFMHRNK